MGFVVIPGSTNPEHIHDNHDIFDFKLTDEEMAEIARKEKNGIKYIKEKTKMDDPFEVAKLYTQLSRPGMFKTAVGFAFLIELQEYLYANPYIENTDIRCIRIPDEEKLRQRHEIQKEISYCALFCYYFCSCYSCTFYDHICERTQSLYNRL